MKWSIIGLVVLGLVAAGCAAVLAGVLRVGMRPTSAPGPQKPDNVEIVVAAKDLQALSVVEAGSILTQTVSVAEAPERATKSPVNVVGRVLALPMVKGQPFTSGCFATEGSGQVMAAALPQGMLAVGIPVNRHTGLAGLLYPGSVVDVLVSFEVPGVDGKPKEALSTVLIEAVEVLAIEDRTIVSGSADERESPDSGRSSIGSHASNVTLMVNPRQAEALQLAMKHGTLSLGMRNPLDATGGNRKPTVLADLSDEFLSRLIRTSRPGQAVVATVPKADAQGQIPLLPGAQRPLAPPALDGSTESEIRQRELPEARWETLVIRGSQTTKESFPLHQSGQ
jgi:pilus assembly protein CpaB